MAKKDNKDEKDNNLNQKKYISLITGKIHCNKIFDLTEGKEIPKDVHKSFIQSLLTNKTIKEI